MNTIETMDPSRENPPMDVGQTLQASGIQTNYHDQGSGRPLLLLHGSGPGVTAWANWRVTMPVLATQFRVIAPDLAGFGYTACPPGTRFGLSLWLRHIVDFLDALHLEKVSVIGNSFGGALALALAVAHPMRVEKLVLMGSAGVDFELTPGLDAVWGYQPSLANMRALMDWFAFDRSLANDDLVALRYRASIRHGVQEAYSSMFPAPRQEAIRKLAQPEDTLRQLAAATLLVHGREDRVVPLETSLHLHALLPRSELHVFGQCGHWVQIEKAERFSTLVTTFLQS